MPKASKTNQLWRGERGMHGCLSRSLSIYIQYTYTQHLHYTPHTHAIWVNLLRKMGASVHCLKHVNICSFKRRIHHPITDRKRNTLFRFSYKTIIQFECHPSLHMGPTPLPSWFPNESSRLYPRILSYLICPLNYLPKTQHPLPVSFQSTNYVLLNQH